LLQLLFKINFKKAICHRSRNSDGRKTDASRTAAFLDVTGKLDYEVFTVYHVFEGDYIGSNGKIHSLRSKKQPGEEAG